jgi:methylthioribose-1-phosphate isomerase
MKPILWEGKTVRILDQRKLPHSTEWVVVKNAMEMADAIQKMVLRGAPLIGIAAAYGLALEANNTQNLESLEKTAAVLQNARPTAVNLSWAITRVLEKARQAAFEKKPIRDTVLKEAFTIHEEDRQTCFAIAKNGVPLLPEGSALTYCNTGALATGGIGTAYGILKEGYKAGKISHVFVCESRPFLQGARLTAYELKEDKIPFTLITDATAGYLMRQKKIQVVVVGADRIAENGDTANKIGTYTLAVLAKENSIPFFVAAPTSSFDFSIPTGESIPIEERDPKEVVNIMGVSIAPQETHAVHWAFDITPACYISAIITEKEVLYPSKKMMFQE